MPDLPADGASAGSRRSSALVAGGILVSRVTGLARERALGHFFGTSSVADAFTAAFRIPNMLQHLLGEGVLSASFIPVYSRLLADGREREAARVAGAILGLLTVAASTVALLGVVAAEPLTRFVAAGFGSRPETFDLTVDLVRILFPSVGFLVLSAWCLGILNSHRRFFLSYVAPAALNVAQIAVLVVVGVAVLGTGPGSPEHELRSLVTWLAVGTLVGGALQFLVQLPAVLRITRGVRPSLRTDLPGVRSTVRAFGPVVAARGVLQVSAFVQVLLASFLAAGALATLRYAQILYLLPISLFGMSVAAAELPELSRQSDRERAAAAERLQQGLARIAAFVVPTALGYLVLGDLVTGALFRSGAFGRVDSIAVWAVLAAFAVGLVATTSSRLLQSALYSVGDTRTPARTSVARVVLSSALGFALMYQLDRIAVTAEGIDVLGDLPAFRPLPGDVRSRTDAGDVARLGAAGLAAGTAVAAWFEYVVLRRAVRRTVGPTSLAGGQLRPTLIAAAIAVAVAAALRPLALSLPPLVGGLAVVAVTAAVYVPLAIRLGVTEVNDVLAALRRRLRGR